MSDFNPYSAPEGSFQPSRDFQDLGDEGGYWQDGKFLVVRNKCQLPDRCVKCGAEPAGHRLHKTYSWHPSGYYLVILLNVLIYALVAILVRSKGEVNFSLCEEHWAKRSRAILTAWLIAFGGIGLFVLGFFVPEPAAAVIPGIVAIVVALIYGNSVGLVLQVNKIRDGNIWLKGVTPGFCGKGTAYPEIY